MSDKPVVSLKGGKVSGAKETSCFSGAVYYSFYGIPYAQPPIGDLRFKDPVKVQPWKGLRDGIRKKGGCLQFSYHLGEIVGSEDCLYLNVYTPDLSRDGKPLKSVMVFIHPGGQMWGSPDPEQHGSPDFVMHCDIVYVTISYRLNIFGFLNLNLPECSGNQAFKDVIMAFQWINENIQAFNGDPANITAMGSSSGADIVHMLTLSPAAKGLLHKAIFMGHFLFNPLVPHHSNHIELALEYSREFGFKGDNKKKLLRYLKKIPPLVLLYDMKKFRDKHHENVCRSYEGPLFLGALDNKVLPVSPRQLFQSMQRVPTMFGICEKEAALGFAVSSTISKAYFRQNSWSWMYALDDTQLEQIYEQIKSFYYQNKYTDVNDIPLSIKIDILSDAAFSEVYDTLINVISSDLSSPVYVYKFLYQGEVGDVRNRVLPLLPESVEGTFHSDDACYWVGINTPQTEKTKQMIESFTKLLSTFAKTGNPNYDGIEEQWKPTTPENPCYLEIDKKMTMIHGKLNAERFKFWDRLKEQFKHD